MHTDAEIRETLDDLAAQPEDEARRVIWVAGRWVCPDDEAADFIKKTDHLVRRAQTVSAQISRVQRKISRYLSAHLPAN